MEILDRIKYFIFPNRCIGCNCAVDRSEILCPSCHDLWEQEKTASCRHCGRSHIHCSCLLKGDEKDLVSVVYHLAEYKRDSIAGNMIIALKRKQNSDICEFLAKEFCKSACDGEDFKNAVVTYVPRRKEVVRETGSDQALEIAKAVCRLTDKELVCCFKRKGKTDQKKLDAQGRRKNASGSYELLKNMEEQIEGKSFFIFDDVITTGATVVACAEILLEFGATKVTAVSVARRT